MKIILNNDVIHLGEEGDVVTVKDGYARNYLLPTGAAVIYNKANAALFKQRAEQIEKRKAEKRAASASLKDRLDNVTISITVTAGESGKRFCYFSDGSGSSSQGRFRNREEEAGCSYTCNQDDRYIPHCRSPL